MATVYASIGGFPMIPVGEDRALHDAASSSGFTVGYPTDLVVRTSGRRHARVTGGGFHHFLIEMATAHTASIQIASSATPTTLGESVAPGMVGTVGKA
jgi:hypothetical protein